MTRVQSLETRASMLVVLSGKRHRFPTGLHVVSQQFVKTSIWKIYDLRVSQVVSYPASYDTQQSQHSFLPNIILKQVFAYSWHTPRKHPLPLVSASLRPFCPLSIDLVINLDGFSAWSRLSSARYPNQAMSWCWVLLSFFSGGVYSNSGRRLKAFILSMMHVEMVQKSHVTTARIPPGPIVQDSSLQTSDDRPDSSNRLSTAIMPWPITSLPKKWVGTLKMTT